jgi:hypothetical protein
LPREDIEQINGYYTVAEHAKALPDFTITTGEALKAIVGMLQYSKNLIEKCDGVWTIRNATSGS